MAIWNGADLRDTLLASVHMCLCKIANLGVGFAIMAGQAQGTRDATYTDGSYLRRVTANSGNTLQIDAVG